MIALSALIFQDELQRPLEVAVHFRILFRCERRCLDVKAGAELQSLSRIKPLPTSQAGSRVRSHVALTGQSDWTRWHRTKYDDERNPGLGNRRDGVWYCAPGGHGLTAQAALPPYAVAAIASRSACHGSRVRPLSSDAGCPDPPCPPRSCTKNSPLRPRIRARPNLSLPDVVGWTCLAARLNRICYGRALSLALDSKGSGLRAHEAFGPGSPSFDFEVGCRPAPLRL